MRYRLSNLHEIQKYGDNVECIVINGITIYFDKAFRKHNKNTVYLESTINNAKFSKSENGDLWIEYSKDHSITINEDNLIFFNDPNSKEYNAANYIVFRKYFFKINESLTIFEFPKTENCVSRCYYKIIRNPFSFLLIKCKKMTKENSDGKITFISNY